jgi:hypothetical protein
VSNKRKETEKLALTYIGKIGNEDDVERYKKLFKTMSDKDFHNYMLDIRDKKKTIRIIEPNGSQTVPDIEAYLNISRELGYEPFQQVLERMDNTDIYAFSRVKDLCVYTAIKRLSQHTIKKMSIPKHTKSRDTLTGQVTNKSKATKITAKELSIYHANGMDKAVEELMLARTGDQGAETALAAFIEKYGDVSLDDIRKYAEGRQATKSLKAYFKAMNLELKM